MQHLIGMAILSSLLFFQWSCFAYDLGVYGETWEIEEQDMREVIYAQAKAVDWQKLGWELGEQAEQIGEHLPPNDLPEATTTLTTFINPSIALAHDMTSNGEAFYHRGSWVNPLQIVRPLTHLLFFDTESLAQKQLAYAALKAYPSQLVLVITKGNPVKLAKDLHHPIYYAFPEVVKRFHIQATPTLLGVGELGSRHAEELAATCFAKPYLLTEIKRCWYGCL